MLQGETRRASAGRRWRNDDNAFAVGYRERRFAQFGPRVDSVTKMHKGIASTIVEQGTSSLRITETPGTYREDDVSFSADLEPLNGWKIHPYPS